MAECSSAAIGGATAMHIQSQMSCQAILSCPTALHADDVGNKYYFDMTQQMVSWGKEDFYTLQYNRREILLFSSSVVTKESVDMPFPFQLLGFYTHTHIHRCFTC